MGLIRRIENGTTTTRDADTVVKIIHHKVGLFLSGIGVGILFIIAVLAILWM